MKKFLLFAAAGFVILIVLSIVCSQPEQATALSPCGANPTPAMAASCAREVRQANRDTFENAATDFSSSLAKGSN